ncbi:hypothetical protein MMC30_002228 [Trapelia coarctata]|nr:hypothetical protein [Trapelia coarctata]
MLPKAPSDILDNYVLRIQLEPEEFASPPIIRELFCPANATFHQLHRALQVTFSWATTHTYDFVVKDPSIASSSADEEGESMEALIAHLRAGMDDPLDDQRGIAKPYLLRLVEPRRRQPSGFGPGSSAIDYMYDRNRRHDASPMRMSTDMLLRDVLEDQRYSGKKLEYCYDFGDSWDHEIRLVARKPPARAFKCVGGQGHAAAEDVGSIKGWQYLVQAYRVQRPNQEQEQKISWYEKMCSNGDARGLKGDRVNHFDKDGINQILQEKAYLV